MEILEEKISAFLKRKGAGAQLTALEIAKGVGLMNAKDVNKALYSLQGKCRLQKAGGTPPLWSLVGSSASAAVNDTPKLTGTPSKHKINTILKSHNRDEGVTAKKLARNLNQPSRDVEMLSGGEAEKSYSSKDGSSSCMCIDEDGNSNKLARNLNQPSRDVEMLSGGEVEKFCTSKDGSFSRMCIDEDGSSNNKKEECSDDPDDSMSPFDESSDILTSHSTVIRDAPEDSMSIFDKRSDLLTSHSTVSRFLEDYSSVKKHDKGAFGFVYKAKRKLLETDCVIKVVEFDEHALREVKALELFQHPNIVRYFTYWIEASPPHTPKMSLYIEMEFCAGGRLTEWITERNKGVIRSKKEARNIFQEIVNGVEYIHSQEHIHRDLKPDNILFGNNGAIKIGDFGFVTTITNRNGASIERTTGKGTPSYMSPEQKNQCTYDEKVDIFPLGLIFFELLWRIGIGMERAKLWPGLRCGKFPEKFRKEYTTEHVLIRKMLSEAPENRPGAKAIAKQLNVLLGEEKENLIQTSESL